MTMETSNDNNNPWSFQQHSQEEEGGQLEFPPHSLKLRLRRSSNDRRHLSFASTTTIAADATEEQYEKDLDFYAGHEYQPDSSLQEDDGRSTRQQPLFTQSWQYDGTSGPDLRETGTREHPSRHHSALSSSSSTSSSHETSFSQRQEASSEEASAFSSTVDPVETTRAKGLQEMTLADSGVGLEGGVLDHQVQKLQSEVADTRAIVFHLESRLNAAENSNKHIVEELKILLADAEGTLVGSDDSDSEDSLIVNSKLGSGSDEDSNVVYNRICHALQTLITEAQTALVRTTPTTPPPQLNPVLHRHHLVLDDMAESSREGYTDDGEHSQTGAYRRSSCSHSNSNSNSKSTSRRSSVNSILRVGSPYTHTSSPRRRVHSSRSAFSKMLWKEKQQEQYERYRRSCDRVSLELEMLINDTILDATPGPLSSPRLHSSNTTSSTHSKDQLPPTIAPKHSSANSVQERNNATGAFTAGSRVATLQQRYHTDLLRSQYCTGGSHLQQQRRHHILAGQQRLPVMLPYKQTQTPPNYPDRHFKNQGAGQSRPQSIFVQLYMLWKQTWLRKRIMHVLTGSVEVILIVCVVLKITEISLEWIGFRMLKGLGPQQWLLSHFYGDGDSSAGAAAAAAGSFEANELYEKILGEGLRLRQMDKWRQQESESLMKEYIASEVASGVPRTPFTAAGMVWRPAGRMIGHAVSGIVLAYLSDRSRSIARRL